MQNLNRRTGRKGQGLIEYILVVFLMAIGCIAVITQLQHSTKTGFQTASTKLDDQFSGG